MLLFHLTVKFRRSAYGNDDRALICLGRRKISNKVRSTIITFFLVLFLHKKQELIQNYADQRIVLQKCYTCKSRVNYCVDDITLNIFLSHFMA